MKDRVMSQMIDYFGMDVKRINHAIKVNAFSELIGNLEKVDETQMKTITYSSLLHDIGIKIAEEKYHSCSGKYQEIEGPPVAKSMLKNLNVSDELIDRVSYIIGHHHSYNKIDGIDFQIVVEADLIVNSYEEELSWESIQVLMHKYVKTESGKHLIEQMYDRRI